jgi:hypothetical protein
MAFDWAGWEPSTTAVSNLTAFITGCPYDTMVYGNVITYAMPEPPPRLPPKNWRWFDVFRLWLARIPSGFLPSCAMRAPALMRVATAPSVTQMRRQKRKLGVQRGRTL